MPALKKLPKIKNLGTKEAMIAVATSQVGFREGNNNNTPYGIWYRMNNVAWCAIFISWCAYVAGCAKVIPKHAWTPGGAAWFKTRKQWGTKPKVGAIVYFYSVSMGRISHVELVVKVYSNGDFLSCGGNTNNTGSRSGNGVYLLRRTTTRGGGFGYPKYKPSSKPALEPAKQESNQKEWQQGDGFPGPEVFVLGKKHNCMPNMRDRLREAGFIKSKSNSKTFRKADRRAVRRFQLSKKELRGDADGYPGKLTWRLLGDAVEK